MYKYIYTYIPIYIYLFAYTYSSNAWASIRLGSLQNKHVNFTDQLRTFSSYKSDIQYVGPSIFCLAE